MKSRIMIKSSMLILFFLLLCLLIPSTDAFASTVKKNGIYSACLGTKKASDKIGAIVYVKKLKLSGKKLTTYGSFTLYNSMKDLDNCVQPTMLKAQKRIFVLKSNTKYYFVSNPNIAKPISKSKGLKMIKKLDASHIISIMVKNKKVSKIYLYDSKK